MNLAHISAVCSTTENAHRFYGDLLGLELTKEFSLDAEMIGQIFGKVMNCQILLFVSKNLSVEVFIDKDGLSPTHPFTHSCLEVGNKQRFLRKCEDEGLEVTYIPKGDKVLSFLRDFDGNLYEVK